MARCGVLALAVVLLLPGCASNEFVRKIDGESGGHVDVRWVRMKPPAGRPPVELVSMIHFASAEFYAAVRLELERSSVVVMEGIRASSPTTTSAPRSGERPLARLDRAFTELAKALLLVTQHDALGRVANGVSFDLTEAEVEASTPSGDYLSGVERLSEDVRRVVAELAQEIRHDQPEIEDAEIDRFVRMGPLRAALAERMIEPPSNHPVLIVARNAAVMRGLDSLVTDGLVSICYGADHGPNFLRALEDRGYRIAEERWVTLFDFERTLRVRRSLEGAASRREPLPDPTPRPPF